MVLWVRAPGLSSPGRWGLLAPFGSSVAAWEMRGPSGAQMSPSLGRHSAMGGASAEFSGPSWSPNSPAPVHLQPHHLGQPSSSLVTLLASLTRVILPGSFRLLVPLATPHPFVGLTSRGPFLLTPTHLLSSCKFLGSLCRTPPGSVYLAKPECSSIS